MKNIYFFNIKIQNVIISIILLFSLNDFAFSQNTGNIKGKIIDKNTGNPIADVNILAQPGNIGSITNSEGYYKIEGLKPGTSTLTVSHINYNSVEQSVEIIANKSITQDFELEPIVKTLTTVNILSELNDKQPYLVAKIKARQLEETSIHDIGDYLKSVPNVSAIRKGGTALDPVIRGLKFSQLNIQLDHGIKIEGGCPNRMDPTASHIEPEDIDNIEIIKGPFALKYGPSLGGVVNINTIKPIPYENFEIHLKGIRGYESNWNGNREYLRINGGSKKIFFDVSGTRKNYGNYEDGNGNEVLSSFDKYSYKAQLSVIPFKNHIINFSYGEYHSRDVRYPALQMDEREDNTRLMSFDYKGVDYTKWLKEINFKIYESRIEHLMDNYYRSKSDTMATNVTVEPVNTGGRLEGTLLFGKHNINAGIDYENIVKDGTRNKNMIGMMPIVTGSYNIKTEKLWNNAEINNLGIFAEYKSTYNIFDILGLLRVDFNNASSDDIIVKNLGGADIFHYASDSASTDYTNISGALGLTGNINENFSVSLALGRGVRSPDMLERFIMLLPVGYDNFDYVGNPQLKPEINNEADITIRYNNKKYGNIELNAFYAYVNDFIMGKRLPKSDQMPLSENVLAVKKFVNSDEPVILNGFEFAWASPQKYNLTASLSAAYTTATIKKILMYVTDSSNTNIVADKEIKNDPLSEIPPFEGNINLNYRFFKNRFNINGQIRIVASQKRVSEAMYEPQTDGFTIANLSLTYHHNKYISATAGVNNLFDEAYYEHLNRRIIGSKTARLYEPGRVFFINLVIDI